MDLLQILVNLVLTGILLYVFQRVIDERSAKRLEKFKAELQSTAFEKEVKFSKLHEARVQILSELYKKLSRIKNELFLLKLIAESDGLDENIQQKLDRFNVSIDDFQDYFEDNRLSLPEDLCGQLYSFLLYAANAWSNLSKAYMIKDYLTNAEDDKEGNVEHYKKSLSSGSSKINDHLVPLIQEIEKEIRSLIGSASK